MSSRTSTRELYVRIAGSRNGINEKRLRAAAPGLRFEQGGRKADFVLLASDDYERLLDEADERGARNAFRRTRREEYVPMEIADRLLRGESRMRVWRKHRGLTLAELSARTGLSKGYLSDVENGKRKGTLTTLRSIGKSLRVTVDDLA
jgi:DNA-binding XRE family transcriptional regulator